MVEEEKHANDGNKATQMFRFAMDNSDCEGQSKVSMRLKISVQGSNYLMIMQ